MTKQNKTNLLSGLKHKIIFLENIADIETDEPIWQEKFNCFAEITSINDYRYTNIDGLTFGNFITEEYYLFKIRYMKGLNKNFRISFGEKLYSIKRIVNLMERNKMLNIITHKIAR